MPEQSAPALKLLWPQRPAWPVPVEILGRLGDFIARGLAGDKVKALTGAGHANIQPVKQELPVFRFSGVH